MHIRYESSRLAVEALRSLIIATLCRSGSWAGTLTQDILVLRPYHRLIRRLEVTKFGVEERWRLMDAAFL